MPYANPSALHVYRGSFSGWRWRPGAPPTLSLGASAPMTSLLCASSLDVRAGICSRSLLSLGTLSTCPAASHGLILIGRESAWSQKTRAPHGGNDGFTWITRSRELSGATRGCVWRRKPTPSSKTMLCKIPRSCLCAQQVVRPVAARP